MDKKQNKTIEYTLDEIISPIFGDDYQNRIIVKKEIIKDQEINDNYISNFIEQHIDNKVTQINSINNNKKYQTKVDTDIDIIKNYQQNQREREIMNNLPSKYLEFRDNLKQNTEDLTMLNDNENNENTISQVINDIFDNNKEH